MAAKDRQILSNLVKRMKNREADPLRPLLDEYLLRREASGTRYEVHPSGLVSRFRPGGRLSPSAIGGCERQAAFKFLGVVGRRRLDPDLELIFDDGNWRHHRWQAIFLDMERVLGPKKFRVVSYEGHVKFPELFIAGNSDVVVEINGVRYVIDIKGIADWGFAYIYTNDAPKEEHVDQLHCYMAGEEVELGLLHYDNKNDQRTRTFVVKFDPERFDYIRRWCKRVVRSLINRELPPMHPECDAGNFLFEKCPYAGLCYGRKPEEQILREVYVEFPGVKRAYRRSFEAVEASS
jgi:CRISPR/Cas system-associated exonuclease Cas4 (RecB family)